MWKPGTGPSAFFRQRSPSQAERSGVQNRGSSVTIGGSGVPAGRPTGQSSPGRPQAGGQALRRGGACQEGSPALERGSVTPKVSGHIPNYCNNN